MKNDKKTKKKKPVRDADVKKQRFFQRKSNEARLMKPLRLAKWVHKAMAELWSWRSHACYYLDIMQGLKCP